MNETNVQASEDKGNRPLPQRATKWLDLGWGSFLVVAGLLLFANDRGWVSLKLGWVLAFVLVTMGWINLCETCKKK